MKFVDPRSDIVFKKLFEHKDLLMSFLNGLLPLPAGSEIIDLEYRPTELSPAHVLLKRPIVDVRAQEKSGRSFIVEMQMEWDIHFINRMVANIARLYSNQLHKGTDWDTLSPVYGVGILSHTSAEKSLWEGWYHVFRMTHGKQPHTLECLTLLLLELSKFQPVALEHKKLGLLWMRFMREITHLTEIPAEFKAEPTLLKACEIANEAGYSPAELEGIDKFWMSVSDERTLENSAERRGLDKGREEGRAEGREEGAHQKALAIALHLKSIGLDHASIAAATGLTRADVEGLEGEGL